MRLNCYLVQLIEVSQRRIRSTTVKRGNWQIDPAGLVGILAKLMAHWASLVKSKTSQTTPGGIIILRRIP